MANRNLDEYQPKRFYTQNTKARENGFAKFEKDGAYYFALYQDGDIVMLSQAYKGIAGRDNGIESVKKNRRLTKRYRFDDRAGKKYGFGLYAGNGQEIAISANLSSRAEAERVAGRLNGSVKRSAAKPKAAPKKPAKKKTAPKKKAVTAKAAPKKRAASDEDNYKRLSFYERQTKGRKNGIESFKGDDGQYYFAHFENGKIRLISEGYPTTTARDTGVASVEKNIKLEKRYDYRGPLKNGKYEYRLKAGNGQEIAISANLSSRAEAERVAGRLNGSVKSRAKPKAAPKKPVKKKAAPKRIVAAKAAPKKRVANDEDNYQRLAFYQKHTKGRKNGIEKFKGNDGQFYFAHFENNKIRLISESYPTAAARDTGAASVQKNIKLEKRYDYRGPLKNGKYDFRLKAGNGKEIARSVWYGSAAGAATGAAYLIGTRKRAKPKPRVTKPKVAAAAIAPKPKPKPKVIVPPKPVPPKPVAPKVVAPKPVAPTPPPVAKPAAPVIAAAATAAAAAPVVAAKAAAPIAAAPVATAAATGGGLGFLKWLIPLLLALLAAFFLFKFCVPKTPAVVVPAISCCCLLYTSPSPRDS